VHVTKPAFGTLEEIAKLIADANRCGYVLSHALLLPSLNIVEACETYLAALLERQVPGVHRRNDPCTAHAFAFADLLNAEPYRLIGSSLDRVVTVCVVHAPVADGQHRQERDGHAAQMVIGTAVYSPQGALEVCRRSIRRLVPIEWSWSSAASCLLEREQEKLGDGVFVLIHCDRVAVRRSFQLGHLVAERCELFL